MGISLFNPLLQIIFPTAIIPFNWSTTSLEYDYLLLDLNCLLYTLRSAQQDDIDLILEVLKYIDRLLHLVRPKHGLYLALDGTRTQFFIAF